MYSLRHRLFHTSCIRNSSAPIKQKIENAVTYYESLIGFSDVKQAQADVMKCEENLSQAQLLRRDKQIGLKAIQTRIKDIHAELDRTARGDDRYLHLLTEEHAAIKKEQSLLSEFEAIENAEREAFRTLSNKVRWSHEKQREYGERTKYWSITGSAMAAICGIFGTYVATELRMRPIHKIATNSQEVRPILDLIHQEQQQVTQFVSEMKDVLRLDSPQLSKLNIKKADGNGIEVISVIKDQCNGLMNQLKEIKRFVALEQALTADPNAVVYVGDDMENLLKKTEKNLESKMKLQTLVTVVVAYAVLGVAAPLLYLWLSNQ